MSDDYVPLDEARAARGTNKAEPAEDDAEVLERLADLPPIEYERVRQTEAERLGIRVTILDAEVQRRRGSTEAQDGSGTELVLAEIEPWPEAVDGARLLDELKQSVRRHVVLSDAAAEAVALWVLHAHAHDTSAISPILAITSPTPGCGKTTLLTWLGALVPRMLSASNVTAAALFRAVEKWRPTLLIDEADTFLSRSEDLRGVLDSGHNRATGYVLRTAGEDHEPRNFKTWAPKAIALIGRLPPTLESRSVHIELRRIGVGEHVDPLRGDKLDHLAPLARMAARWVSDNAIALRNHDPVMPSELRGRAADNWRHLIAIADRAGGDWPRWAREAATRMCEGRSEQTAGIKLLEDLRALFSRRGVDRLASADIIAELGAMEDRPWSEWRNGQPITSRGLAKLLDPFGIVPGTIRIGHETPKGYQSSAFDDAFSRYLPPENATPPQPNESAASGQIPSATSNGFVADTKPRKAAVSQACGGVADRSGESWEETL